MTDDVRVTTRAILAKVGETDDDKKHDVTQNDARNAVQQALEDAVYGTFGEYPDYFGPPRLQAEIVEHPDYRGGGWSFTFDLPAEMFPVGAGGLQHLIGVLCGDAFGTPTEGIAWEHVEFTDVELPAAMVAECQELFQPIDDSLGHVRESLGVRDGWPLLAFTFKPRVGSYLGTVQDVTLDVLGAGFDLVEPDTRRLLHPDDIPDWASNVGRRAAAAGDRTAFAPNLTLPADLAAAAARTWRVNCLDGPFVVKVDGGLDGLSAMQAIRRDLRIEEQPIITCYPLFRKALGRLPRNFWVDVLILSGADVIYPGDRPNFPEETRPIWADDNASDYYLESAERYDDIIARRRMPTYAGGASPGQLHVAYELLGPDTGMFLGGAVALHEDGPAAGAKLCHDIVEAAVGAVKKTGAKRPHSDGLVGDLIPKMEQSYPDAVRANYVRPEHVFAPAGVRRPVEPHRQRVGVIAEATPPIASPSVTEHLWCAADAPFVKGTFSWVFGLLLFGLVFAAFSATAAKPERGEPSTPYEKAKKTIKDNQLFAAAAIGLGFAFAILHSVLYASTDGESCGIELSGAQDFGVWVATVLFVLAIGSFVLLWTKLTKS